MLQINKMIKSNITYRWFLSVFSLMLFFLTAVEIFYILMISGNLYGTVSNYLEKQAEINENYFKNLIVDNYYDFNITARELMQEDSNNDKLKVQIIGQDGRVVISSDNYTPPDAINIKNIKNSKESFDDPYTGERIMSMTVLLKDKIGNSYGAIRFTSSLKQLQIIQSAYIIISVITCLLVAFLVFLSGLYFIRSIVMPVNMITQSAQLIAKGDFNVRIKKKHDDEIGNLSDALNNMALELSKIDQLKNNFISSISHELRTPLTAIKGWSETIAMCDPKTDNEMIIKGLNIIDNETDRLSKMVEELLDYTKIQSGRFTIIKTKVNLLKLVLDTLEIYDQKAIQSNIELKFDLPTFEPIISGDNNKLKQVFINVLDNAIKHSFSGGEIEIKMAKMVSGYVVAIKDYGSGIKDEELPLIKERFYKGSSTKPGSGLGLAISNEVVKLHGGGLDIYSKEGSGTTVVISLPVDGMSSDG